MSIQLNSTDPKRKSKNKRHSGRLHRTDQYPRNSSVKGVQGVLGYSREGETVYSVYLEDVKAVALPVNYSMYTLRRIASL